MEGLVFVNLSPEPLPAITLHEQCSTGLTTLVNTAGSIEDLVFVQRKVYDMPCNWKVFVDNYNDGGYHVPYAHPGLADAIDMSSYSIELYDYSSAQICGGSESETARVGKGACYTYIYPHFMLNRYGPWLDTNTVIPTGTSSCRVIFDYFLDAELAEDAEFVSSSMVASDGVQEEDHFLCMGVQAGLTSSGYDQGRYNPQFEGPMHHFHALLYRDYEKKLSAWEQQEILSKDSVEKYDGMLHYSPRIAPQSL
jgi:choline monooxygenase